jgi:hypothetical protein
MSTSTKGRRRVAQGKGAAVADGPDLGRLSFEDWFETPIFEVDADERLENLATSRRRPARLAASTVLAVNARTTAIRRPRISWRDRLSAALDRWADNELAMQQRLELALTPRRWKA